VTQALMIATGGALGALLRFWSAQWVHSFMGRSFPYGTLMVNIVGSLAMGFMFVMLFERFNMGPEWRGLIMIGLLGAFTTFATFSIETLHLLNNGELLKAGLNILLSVVLCIAAAWLGMLLGRQI